jgi:3'(2'), 5'-bisphosphate nucleotidase
MDLKSKFEVALQSARLARETIMDVYAKPIIADIKSDDSPVTEADRKADAIIRKVLSNAFPEDAFLTEESSDNPIRLKTRGVWIVDPVDGTKDFIQKNGEFTTNIAYVVDHEVVIGLVFIPVWNEYYFAIQGEGAFHVRNGVSNRIHVNAKTEQLTVLVSRNHFNLQEKAMIQKYQTKITKQASFGSSIKACKIAEGEAEISYRLSDGTKEWDTAASQLIVEEAGGLFIKPDGTRYLYNRKNVKNTEGYLIVNRKENILL